MTTAAAVFRFRVAAGVFVLLLLLFTTGCASTYVDSSDTRPRLAAVTLHKSLFVRIRTMPFRWLKSTLVDGGYCREAIYLAQHSTKKIRASAPGPTGTGYLMEVVQNDRVIDRFEFWPTEVVVHGQRWQITDTELAAKLRMLWFAEMPRD